MVSHDVIIVGGGPAGSACAWKLNQAGLDVLVLDKKTFPREKLCAGWITPSVLDDLEVEQSEYPHGLVSFSVMHFHFYAFYLSHRVPLLPKINLRLRGLHIPVKTRQFSIRRYEFDNWLRERSGVPYHCHTVKHIIRNKGGFIIDDEFSCKYIVGAGGTLCPVYRNIFRDQNPKRKRKIATLEKELQCDFQEPGIHAWFFENDLPGYSWYVPKNDGYLNVGIGANPYLLKKRGLNLRGLWDRFLAGLVEKGFIRREVAQTIKPGGWSYFLRDRAISVSCDNAFIVGDSAGLATVDLGEGIGPAVKSGVLAARAIITGTEYSLDGIDSYSFPGIPQDLRGRVVSFVMTRM